jgi:hypothetical protein
MTNTNLTLIGSVVSIAELLSRVFATDGEYEYSSLFESVNKEGSDFIIKHGGGFVEISVSEKQEILSMVNNPFRSTIIFIEMLRQIKSQMFFQSGIKMKSFFGFTKDSSVGLNDEAIELVTKWHDSIEEFLYGKN